MTKLTLDYIVCAIGINLFFGSLIRKYKVSVQKNSVFIAYEHAVFFEHGL